MQEVQDRTTSTEFVEWIRYLDELPNEFDPIHFYLAQVAAEVRRGVSKDPGDPATEDFILWFVPSGRTADPPSNSSPAPQKEIWVSDEEYDRLKAAAVAASKKKWMGRLRMESPPE